MASTETRSQNAIFMDMAAFLRTYPEVQAALKDALSALVSKRPGDPISFLAEKLREANRELQEQKREKERAVVKIQSLGRGIRDRQRVRRIKKEVRGPADDGCSVLAEPCSAMLQPEARICRKTQKPNRQKTFSGRRRCRRR